MKSPKTFKIYCDPGHGWIAVKMVFIEALGIADKITSFSYMRGATAYLEEDADACTFIKAYKEKYGEEPHFDTNHTNDSSPIRSYNHYSKNGLKKFKSLKSIKVGCTVRLRNAKPDQYRIVEIDGNKFFGEVAETGKGYYKIPKSRIVEVVN